MAESGPGLRFLDEARRYAALSGPFDPSAALPAALAQTPQEAVVVATRLAELCDTRPAEAPGKWLLRTSERRAVLNEMRQAGQLDREVKDRRRDAADEPTRDLLDALSGRKPFAPGAIERELADPGSLRHLQRLIIALDRAGENAPAYPLIDRLRSATAQIERAQRWKSVEQQGLFGRASERGTIAAWLAKPIDHAPVRALYIRGLPAIGKSLLLDDSIRQALHDDPIVMRFDFDRAGLDVQDVAGLTMEAARQVADQIGPAGPALLKSRLAAASVQSRPDEKTSISLRNTLPRFLLQALGDAIRQSGRSVLILLDTMEVLRNRGDTHPASLFNWLDQLVGAGVAPMRVLAAGRGDALEAAPDRIGEPITLDALTDQAADEMLSHLEVPGPARSLVKQAAGGNPLMLRLAAGLSRLDGRGWVKRTGRRVLTHAFLYRFLLSRIEDPQLRAIIHPGLLVRRISADLIREVLAPKLGIGPIDHVEAERLHECLAQQTWLVERDPAAPGFLRSRPAMRAALLPMIYADMPARAARIDDAASRWFARRREQWASIDAAYHQLQLLRRRHLYFQPQIDREVAYQFDPAMIDELPPAAQDLVLAARGERSTSYRSISAGPQYADDPGLIRELEGIIERRDWLEGEHVIANIVESAAIGPASRAADMIRTFWWRSGRWARARRLLAERDRLDGRDHDLRNLPAPAALARLEMRAEFSPLRFSGWLCEDATNGSLAGELAMSGPDDVGRFGAMGFLLEAAGEGRFRGVGPEALDPARAAVRYWSGDRDAPEVERCLREADRRLEQFARPGDVPAGKADIARLLAIFNPYAGIATTLSTIPRGTRIAESAELPLQGVIDAHGLLPWTSNGPSGSGEYPIVMLARMGLFAEWAGSAALLIDHDDLRLIARSAERWRRTVAGKWGYSIGRPGPFQRPALDETMRLRLDMIRYAHDPLDAALASLDTWEVSPLRAGRDVWMRLHDRVMSATGRVDQRGAQALERNLAMLLARHIPAAFAPGLAVLARHRHQENRHEP